MESAITQKVYKSETKLFEPEPLQNLIGFPMLHPATKLYENPAGTFSVMLLAKHIFGTDTNNAKKGLWFLTTDNISRSPPLKNFIPTDVLKYCQ